MLTMWILDTPHYTVENALGLMKCYVYLIFVQSASALARTGKGRSAEEKKKDEEWVLVLWHLLASSDYILLSHPLLFPIYTLHPSPPFTLSSPPLISPSPNTILTSLPTLSTPPFHTIIPCSPSTLSTPSPHSTLFPSLPFHSVTLPSIVDELLAREKSRKLKAQHIRGTRYPYTLHDQNEHTIQLVNCTNFE